MVAIFWERGNERAIFNNILAILRVQDLVKEDIYHIISYLPNNKTILQKRIIKIIIKLKL
jgi:hypothetical protein